MSISPLEFARTFEKMKVDFFDLAFDDLRLLMLADFFPKIEPHLNEPVYSSYVDDCFSLLRVLSAKLDLSDVSYVEATEIKRMLEKFLAVNPDARVLSVKSQVVEQLCRLLLYLGEPLQAAMLLAEDYGETVVIPKSVDEEVAESPINRCNSIVVKLLENSPRVAEKLGEFKSAWQRELEEAYDDRVWCLFVEQRPNGAFRGRMKVLQASVTTGRTGDLDRVSIDNQIVKPADPFVGVSFHALEAVRRLIALNGSERKRPPFSAHIKILGINHRFTGDSIGLGVAFASYVQLLSARVDWYAQRVHGSIAVTAGITAAGALSPVSCRTLSAKVSRAFYSHVTRLVVCDADRQSAMQIAGELQSSHPNRRLQILSHANLAEAVTDPSIIGRSRRCVGEFVIKKTAGASKSTLVQVPLLTILAYLLFCVVFPKAWVGFDWEPARLNIGASAIIALNAKGQELFRYLPTCDPIAPTSPWTIKDIDNDGESEVLFIPVLPDDRNCRLPHTDHFYYNLVCLSCDGRLLFSQSSHILDEYPGDSTKYQPYQAAPPTLLNIGSEPIIVTNLSRSNPARSHFRFFSANGDPLGWFVEAGANFQAEKCLAEMRDGRVAIIGFNNRASSASLFVLDPRKCSGVAPPLSLPFYKEYEIGNVCAYYTFPRTDLNTCMSKTYNQPFRIQNEADGGVSVQIDELSPDTALVTYRFDSELRLSSVSLSDEFVAIRNSPALREKLRPFDKPIYEQDLFAGVYRWTENQWGAASLDSLK